MTESNVRPFKSRGTPKPPPADGEIEECPVVCLGEHDGSYFFLSTSGELRCLAFREFSRNGILSLFGGKDHWLRQAAPDDKFGWSAGAIAGRLMRWCADAGIFDPATESRGLGVWPADQGVVAHCGDGLWVDGEWAPPGEVIDGAIYGAGPAIERPAFDRPAPREIGVKLRQLLGRWVFRVPSARELLIGYLGCAALGAVGRWHPHALVVGPFGCGKSTLVQLLAAALGDQAVEANNLTGPALYQSFTNTARCFLFDEQDEPEDGVGKIQGVVDLLRQMSSGKGAGIIRGGPTGTAKRYQVVGSALMAGILGVILKPEDRSRISEIELLALPAASADDVDLDKVMAWAGEHSAALRARCILREPQYREAFAIYRVALLAANCDRRQADQLAALLAGRDILLFDHAPDTDSAAEQVAALGSLVADVQLADVEESDGYLCWSHLLSSPIESWSGGDRKVLSQLVMEARESPHTNSERLGAYGLRLDQGGEAAPAVLVANNHQGLERVFAGSKWAKGKWRRSLARLAGACPHPVPMRFAGLKARCVRVPVDHLPKTAE